MSTIYKVNYDKKEDFFYTGTNSYHYKWDDNQKDGNNWNDNLMPGLKAVYGYNIVNVYHFNHTINKGNNLFDKPVLIKTLYYPSFSKDTLNFEPIDREYYLVSVYDEDSNKDGYINSKDLRRFYYFDIDGKNKKNIVPRNCSVIGSEYDSANDFMYVFTKLDENKNGQTEQNEPINIFWVDLKKPFNNGSYYSTK